MQTPSDTKANLTQAVPFFSVTAMEHSLRFYVDGLGFSLVNQWEPRGRIEWCWLQRGGAALMLQESRMATQLPEGATEKRGIGVSICFSCADALAFYHEIIGRGLEASEPFVGNGLWTTQLQDPDGYQLFFNSLTEVPEETTYSQWKK